MNLESLQKKNVLVVDDTVTIHKLLSSQLREMGFNNVTCALNAHMALDVLETDRSEWGIIFCDINMPEMNGIELLKHLRSNPKFNKTIIIMLTIESDIKMVNEAIAAGVNGYILKPYTKSLILKAIEQAISTFK